MTTLQLSEGWSEEPTELGVLVIRWRDGMCERYARQCSDGSVVAYVHGGPHGVAFTTAEEAHRFLIASDSDSPFEVVTGPAVTP
jgi:hypothetical protein